MRKELEELSSHQNFKDWQKEHPKAFLSHFFGQISSLLDLKSKWEIGYYDPTNNKITVFLDKEIKPEDDVFKKEISEVEELDLSLLKVDLKDAKETCFQNLTKLFPGEQFGDGFLVVQTLKGKLLWNFTLITKSLKFVNVKIDATTGEVVSHEEVKLVEK